MSTNSLSQQLQFNLLVKYGYKIIKLSKTLTPIDAGFTKPDFIYETEYEKGQYYGIVGGSTHKDKEGNIGKLLLVDFDVKEKYLDQDKKICVRVIPEASAKLEEHVKPNLDARDYYRATTKTRGLHAGVLSNEGIPQAVSLYEHQECPKLRIDTRTEAGYVVAIAPNYTITNIPELFDRVIPNFEYFMLSLGFVPTSNTAKSEQTGNLFAEQKRKAREALDHLDHKIFPEFGTEKISTHNVVTFWTMSCKARGISEDETVEKIMYLLTQINTSKSNLITEKDIRRLYNKQILNSNENTILENHLQTTINDKEIQQLKKLSDIDDSEFANRRVKVNAVVASNFISYNVPTRITVCCTGSTNHNCVKNKEVNINQISFAKFVEIPDYKRHKLLENYAKSEFTSDCELSLTEIETTTIRRLRIRPIVSSLYKQESKFFDDSGNEWSAYDIYVLQNELRNLEAGKEIEVIGTIIADPKTGKITMLVDQIKFIDENKFDMDKINDLREFCRNKTLDEIICFYTSEFEKYSRIVKRKNVSELGLLTFFSPLYLDFEGKKIPSWIKTAIIGDSTTGKSETIRQMIILLKAGQIVSGEMASVAGLAGASVQASGGQWFTDFGIMPLQDRKFLTIDGAHKLRKDELDRLAEAERNGKIEINKAAKGEAYARTRQIKIFNPLDEDGITTIPMDSFLYPVQALKHTLQIQSISRIDLVCFVPDDVSVKERNIQVIENHDKKLEYLSDLVRLCWAGKCTIIFENDVIQTILNQSIILENKFKFDEYPLVTNDQKYKLAKLASSLAYLTCSFDDNFGKLIVKKEHVEYIAKMIDKEYTQAGLSDLASQNKFNEIDLEYLYNILKTIDEKIGLEMEESLKVLDWVTKQPKINRDDLMERCSLSRDNQAQPLLTYLKNEKLIKMARNHYSVTKKGVSVARFIASFSSSSSSRSTNNDTPLKLADDEGGVSLLVELQALHALKIKTYKCNDCNTLWKNTKESLEEITRKHCRDHVILEVLSQCN